MRLFGKLISMALSFQLPPAEQRTTPCAYFIGSTVKRPLVGGGGEGERRVTPNKADGVEQ